MPARWERELEDRSPLLVFVHGVLSSAEKCWRPGTAGLSWPQVAKSDSRLSGWSIYVAEYYTSVSAANYSISDAANQLWDVLSHEGAFRDRTVVFVCHSMGGVVVRKMLLRYQRKLPGHITMGLFLVASPTYGSFWASFLDNLSRLVGNEQLLALRPVENNAWLSDIDEEFKFLTSLNDPAIFGREIVENWFIYIGRWLTFLPPVVSRREGTGVFATPAMIGGTDHFTITRPATPGAQQHLRLMQLIEKVKEHVNPRRMTLPQGTQFGQLEAVLSKRLLTDVEFTGFSNTAAVVTCPRDYEAQGTTSVS